MERLTRVKAAYQNFLTASQIEDQGEALQTIVQSYHTCTPRTQALLMAGVRHMLEQSYHTGTRHGNSHTRGGLEESSERKELRPWGFSDSFIKPFRPEKGYSIGYPFRLRYTPLTGSIPSVCSGCEGKGTTFLVFPSPVGCVRFLFHEPDALVTRR